MHTAFTRIGLLTTFDTPSLSCTKWYSFCSVSSPQSSMSSAHSLCGLSLLCFCSITPNFSVLSFTHSGDISKQAHFTYSLLLFAGLSLSCPLNRILCHLLFSVSISLS